jgi:hypothetical protein
MIDRVRIVGLEISDGWDVGWVWFEIRLTYLVGYKRGLWKRQGDG